MSSHCVQIANRLAWQLGQKSVAGERRLVLSNLARSGLDAFDLSTWTLEWRVRRTGGFMGPYADPDVVGDTVYAGWQHADALAIDLNTGREHWSTAVRGGIWDVAACRNEVVVQHFALTWLDRRTGAVRASNMFENSSEYPTSDVATDGERVFVTSKGRAYAYRCE